MAHIYDQPVSTYARSGIWFYCCFFLIYYDEMDADQIFLWLRKKVTKMAITFELTYSFINVNGNSKGHSL